jgi:NAD(P)H-dependent FMN reductase
MTLLLLSGSLRAASSNSALIHAAAGINVPNVVPVVFDGIGRLPHFNPDLDGDPADINVQRWRDALRAADAVLISTPEYAHGLPGTLKNALDWVVGTGEFMHKPVGLLNASAASSYAQASLTETLTVMMAELVPTATALVPLAKRPTDPRDVLRDQPAVDVITQVILALQRYVSAALG